MKTLQSLKPSERATVERIIATASHGWVTSREIARNFNLDIAKLYFYRRLLAAEGFRIIEKRRNICVGGLIRTTAWCWRLEG